MKSDKRGLWKTHLIYLRFGKNNSGKEKGLKHKSLPKEDKQKAIARNQKRSRRRKTKGLYKQEKRKGSPKQEALQTN